MIGCASFSGATIVPVRLDIAESLEDEVLILCNVAAEAAHLCTYLRKPGRRKAENQQISATEVTPPDIFSV